MGLLMFPADVTRGWTSSDMEQLVGRYVSVDVPASAGFRQMYPEARTEGGAGTVVAVDYHSPTDTLTVMWDDGLGWVWNKEDGAYITVCNDLSHGDHFEPAGEACREAMCCWLPEDPK